MNRKILLAFIAIFSIFAVYFSYLNNEKYPLGDIIIEANIQNGTNIEIFINKDWNNSLKQEIIPGRDHKYIFSGVPIDLLNLRIDPTNSPNTSFILKKVIFKTENKTYDLFADNMDGWFSSDCTCSQFKICKSINGDPTLSKSFDIGSFGGKGGNYIFGGTESFYGKLLYSSLLLMVITFFIVVSKNNFQTLIIILYSLIIFYLFKFAIDNINFNFNIIIPVNGSVGHASYFSLNKTYEIIKFNLIAFFVFIVSYVFFGSGRILIRSKTNTLDNNSKKINGYVIFLLIFLFALVAFPDFWWYSQKSVKHLSDYDSQNIATWAYQYYIGSVPYRDLWYPYSSYFYINPPIFPNNIFLFFHKSIIFASILFSILSLLKNKIIQLLLVCILYNIVIYKISPIYTERYFISLSILLIYYNYLIKKNNFKLVFIPLYLIYVSFFELNQVLYALISLIPLFIAYLFSSKYTIKNLVTLASPIFLYIFLLIPIALVLKKYEIYSEYLKFYENISVISKYSMFPANISSWIFNLTKDGLLFTIMVLSIIFSTISFSIFGRRDLRSFFSFSGAVLLGILFQKQLLRPSIVNDLIPVYILFVIILIFYYLQEINIKSNYKKFYSIIIFIILINFTLKFSINDFKSNIQNIIEKFKIVYINFNYYNNFIESREIYFNKNSFVFKNTNANEFSINFKNRYHLSKFNDIYVLGDDSFVYVSLDQQIPPYITYYNSSAIYSQKSIVSWLKFNSPKFILWDYKKTEFDGVPNYLRVPLVFDFIQKNYSFNSKFNNYEVLTKQDNSINSDNLIQWAGFLGKSIDFKGIIKNSNIEKSISNCIKSKSPNIIQINANDFQDLNASLNFIYNGNAYSISFILDKNIKNYYIYLDRLWFFKFFKSPDNLTINTRTNGLNFSLLQCDIDNDILY